MATYTRAILSGSTSGKPIPVVATATLGTTIHTAQAGAAAWDEIYLWANNVHATNAAFLSIEWGAAGVGSALVREVSIPAASPPIPIATGQVLNGGLAVTAFCTTGANLINITGYVNKIA